MVGCRRRHVPGLAVAVAVLVPRRHLRLRRLAVAIATGALILFHALPHPSSSQPPAFALTLVGLAVDARHIDVDSALLSSRSIRLRRQAFMIHIRFCREEVVNAIDSTGSNALDAYASVNFYVHLDVIIIPPKERWSRLQNAVPAPVKVVMNPCTQSEINRAVPWLWASSNPNIINNTMAIS
ncbi:hypothetical protein BJV77DRAFT_1071889 [Russula vinacea]|nr:hypothetical protein BJV77DRAFT_1071889 [Russula vinacea]